MASLPVVSKRVLWSETEEEILKQEVSKLKSKKKKKKKRMLSSQTNMILHFSCPEAILWAFRTSWKNTAISFTPHAQPRV
jgi:hypothetical protein